MRPTRRRRYGMRCLMAAVVGVLLCGAAVAASPPRMAEPKVRIETDRGTIYVRLFLEAAPTTVCNFLRYANGGHYDGGRFFRTVRRTNLVRNAVPIDVIQAEAREGEEADAFGSIRLERTRDTHLTHRAGALSMARWGPDTATSSFSIVARNSPEMDFGGRRNPDGQGFAVFGQVYRGMHVVRRIHALKDIDEKLEQPVSISRIYLEAVPAYREAIGSMCSIDIQR